MKIMLSLCAVILLQCFSTDAFSQSIQVTGKVTSKNANEPLPGATVSIKGKGGATVVTGVDGNFTITVPKSGSILVVSYAGMTALERAVTQAGILNFELETGDPKLDEVVVVGYGTQKKTSLTASVSTVKGADIVRQPVSDLSNALGGRATGVLFTQGSGQAGNDAANIMIRGIGTNGNASPLFIVDGVPRNYSQLNPSDVESITVLKDAAAVAPYGMGGANGVILVTTKRGKTGKPTLSYDGYVGYQNPTVTTHFVNSYQYATMKNVGAANAGATTMPYSAADIQKYKDGSDPDGHPNIDPIADMILKNTLQTSHSLSVNGGTETVKYAMGLGYFDQQGMFPGIKYKRYNLSANLQAQVTKGTTVGLILNGRVESRNLSGSGYNTQSLFENLINTTSISTPLIYSNGKHPYIYASFYDNPSYRNITGNTMLTQFFVEQQLPVKGLSVKFVGSYDWNPFDPYNTTNAGIAGLTRAWSSPFPYYNVDTTTRPYTYPLIPAATLPSFSEEYHQTQAFTYQGYINYNRTFGKSAVTGLVVLEARNTKSLMFSASRNNYNLPITELFAGGSGASDLGNGGNSQAVKQRSLVYRVTYGYNNKYLLEAAGRYDGHYYFAPGHRFGFFPAFSAAWRISKENFMSRIDWINELKIRASYGQSGNLAGAPFQYQSGFTLYGNSSILNGTQGQGLYENQEPNPTITWEKAAKTDIGFEARLFNGLLNVEADYFHENRNNMLVYPNVTVPAEYGVGISQVNAGSMVNHGIEVAISSNYAVSKDLNISFSGNFSYAKNKLIQVFEDPATYDNPNLRKTGRPLGTPFGYKSIGYFTADDFASAGVLKPGIAKQTFSPLAPGEIRYADISGPNGKPDGVIDYNDQIAMGNPTYPAIVYGFSPAVNYKGFELSLLFQGAGQRDVQLANSAAWAFDNNKNASVTTLDYWTPDNPNASYPRLTTTPTANTSQTSTFWQRSVSYLRLRTGALGYTFPKRISERLKMSVLSVYVSGQNIITWTPIKNFDPEVSNARGWYFPTQKALTVGLRVQF